MRITDNQREKLQWATEELEALEHLLERIADQNHDASTEELRDVGILWELILASIKELKNLRKKNEVLWMKLN